MRRQANGGTAAIRPKASRAMHADCARPVVTPAYPPRPGSSFEESASHAWRPSTGEEPPTN